ncbi:uncharacterized protein BXZ73DRAFT_42397 [Epithele typhae]|uniref:uncharacterized protein n=1 Tax=Epithele typhae TaxID=378194 RepID=UPI002008C507|nr:uncharacterized protein BXZ73DRAFT_42397 [Epithele typhae]KAH9940821.1 hypothetical protein BXZ73DRAFT_42397 [Epithele typhae]
MGFIKRFFSLGSSKSRKNKKKQADARAPVDAEGRILSQTQPRRGGKDNLPADTLSGNKLLRSTSTKFSVMSEIDYTSLPPLHLLAAAPSTPSLSPSPSMITVATTPGGLKRSGTYVVKVHERTTHSRTDFPQTSQPESPTKSRSRRKQPKTPERRRRDTLVLTDDEDAAAETPAPRMKEVNFTPKDSSRLYNLRRDPSVVSLLNLFDDHGRLDSKVFENSSPAISASAAPEGKMPRQRTGSTFRELLGAPAPAFFENSNEGDISWAERLLECVPPLLFETRY